MKTFINVINVYATLVCINTITMEQQTITYHRATKTDTEQILSIINEHGINDRTKIVIVPEQFRKNAIYQDILKNRLYCAKDKSDIVAFKKLFIINNTDEYNDITHQEIRCHGDNSILVDSSTIDPIKKDITISNKSTVSFNNTNSIVIYVGGDYTIPSHRDKKINSQLTNHAFEKIKNDTLGAIVEGKDIRKIVLLYGLTTTNAGEYGGIDRTPSIIKSFMQFIEKIAIRYDYSMTTPLYHNRYKAFMPTFDPNNTECKPLPDDQAIPGYGNVLIFPLIKQ